MCVFLVAATVAATASAGQTPLGDVAFRQALADMGTDLRLMCVAAHPDDEDGATLALYRKKYGVKTFAVIATRGEGGQNEIGPELYEELGVIRTFEMQAAAEIEGAELHFLNLPEFGYSKTPEETFEKWGHEVALERMVRLIRELRPDVIITNHGLMKDHGHHQAIGQILLEAFDAAADRERFSEHILDDDLETWQAARLYQRVWTPASDDEVVEVDISELDRARGKTYAEIAAEALDVHQSQGMRFFIDRYLTGRPKAYYKLAKEAEQETGWFTEGMALQGMVAQPARGSLFEGLFDRVAPQSRAVSSGQAAHLLPVTARTTLLGNNQFAPIAKAAVAQESFGPVLYQHARNLRARREASSLVERDWQRANDAAAIAAQLRLSVEVDDDTVVPGQTVNLTARVVDFGIEDGASATLSVTPAHHWQGESPEPVDVSFDDLRTAETTFEIPVPVGQPATLPHANHLFDADFLQPQFTVTAEIDCPDKGTLTLALRQYVDVAPPVSIEFLDAPYLARIDPRAPLEFAVQLTNNMPGPHEDILNLSPSPGFHMKDRQFPVAFAVEGETKILPFRALQNDVMDPREFMITALMDRQNEAVHSTIRAVRLNVPENVKVGVIQSYDDTFVNVLRKLGIPHEALGAADFAAERLDTFTTIIVDIRAYLVRHDLRANNQALLNYIERGGNVIVNYQKTFDWTPEFAPYPISLSRNRVTVEEAPVTLLVPDHPLFNTPNPIVPEDWDSWIQERGLYFPLKWDDAYTPLVDVADPGETIPPGSMLIANYGEGTYLYTALGWYRQLRELHPGALKVFLNMIAPGQES